MNNFLITRDIYADVYVGDSFIISTVTIPMIQECSWIGCILCNNCRLPEKTET
ncbi:hypothetical protein [Methanospirillum sp.]